MNQPFGLAGPPAPPAPSWREFLMHAWLARGRAACVAGGVFAAALLFAALATPGYRAGAVLAVLPSPEFTVRQAAGSHDSSASALALDQIMKAETEILGSDELHAATLTKLGPASIYPAIFAPTPPGLLNRVLHGLTSIVLSPWRTAPQNQEAARLERGLKQFRSDLEVLPAKDSNVISLTYANRRARVAADTVNTLLTLYAARRTGFYDDPQLGIVRREVAQASAAVEQADRALADFKRDHAISDYEAERDMLLRRASQAEQAAADAQAAIAEYQARLAALDRALRAEPATIGVFDETDGDTRLQAVNAGLQDLRAKLAAARDKYKDTSRVVVALQAQIASHQAEAARLTENPARSVVRQGRNPSLDPLRLDRARAAAELSASQARLSAEQSAWRGMRAALVRLDADEADLAALQRRRANADQDFRDASRVLADRHLSEAEESTRLARVRVIQPAATPQTPRATRALIMAAGLVLSGLAACADMLVRFVRRPVFLTGEGLETATGLPVLAVFSRDEETVLTG